jgi:hypothetical protein
MAVPQDLVAVRVFIPVPQLASRKLEHRSLSISLSRLPTIRGYASCARCSAFAHGETLIYRHSLRTYGTPSSEHFSFMDRAAAGTGSASVILDCCSKADIARRSGACLCRSALRRSSVRVVAGIGDASRSLNREGAVYSWRIFEVKCPEYTLFEVVPLELVLLMWRGQMHESASRAGRGKPRRSSTEDCD